tara:strand:+ start:154 stop:378 length:225 start_codon:yes stop_codon:yes gene_type:complete
MQVNQNIVQDCIDYIINTRNFCGNEKEAVIDMLFDDYDIRGQEAFSYYHIANFKANSKWNNFKKQAGVKQKYRF